MTYKVFRIKAVNENVAKDALPLFIDQGNNWVTDGPSFCLVVLPPLYNDDEVMDENGEVVIGASLIDGWHCDISAAEHLWSFIPQDLVVYPDNPRHKMLGEP